jgi:hypothetical protein
MDQGRTGARPADHRHRRAGGTTGTEFQSLYTWLTGMVQGYFGKAAAVAAIGLGALFSLARLNPMPFCPASASRCSCSTPQPSRPAS